MKTDHKWLNDKWWVSPYNYCDEVKQQFDFRIPKRVYFHDVTLRESVQSPRVCLRPEEKIRIAKQLDKLGVDSIETGAYISDIEKELTLELVNMHKRGEIKANIVPLAHCTERDINIAAETGAKRVLISQNINPWLVKTIYGIEENDLISKLTSIIAYAKKKDLFVTAQIYDTYRAPMDFLERLVKNIVFEGGADRIAISDTRGFAIPWVITYMVRKIKNWVPETPIEHHGHNDYGLATAMMVAAVIGGAEVVHTSINGIGERVGNAATEEVAMALEVLLGVNTGIDLSKILSACQLVAELAKHPIARNKPIVGENMFLIEAGQVAWRHKKLADSDRPYADMAFAPKVIGKSGEGVEFILGVGSGKTIVEHKLKQMGISLTPDQVSEIVQRVKEEAYLCKWSLTDMQFEEIIKEVTEK